jgi:hypothetical protein
VEMLARRIADKHRTFNSGQLPSTFLSDEVSLQPYTALSDRDQQDAYRPTTRDMVSENDILHDVTTPLVRTTSHTASRFPQFENKAVEISNKYIQCCQCISRFCVRCIVQHEITESVATLAFFTNEERARVETKYDAVAAWRQSLQR